MLEVSPAALRTARTALGLSAEGFARLVKVESGRTVRRWEAAEREIPGPVQVLVTILMGSQEVRRALGVRIAEDPPIPPIAVLPR